MFSNWQDKDWIFLWFAFVFIQVFLILKYFVKTKNQKRFLYLVPSLFILLFPLFANFNFFDALFSNIKTDEILISITIYSIIIGGFMIVDKKLVTNQNLFKFKINDISFMALMVSLATVFSKLPLWLGIPNSISITGNSNMVIGIGWIPVLVGAFALGPVKGFVLGLTYDTVGWIIGGYAWHYLQAIQEPVIGIVAGTAGLLYIANINKKFIKTLYASAVSVFVLFVFMTLILNDSFVYSSNGETIVSDFELWFVLSIILLMMLFIGMSLALMFIQSKKHKEQINTMLLIATAYIVITLINTFIFSPLYFLVRFDVPYHVSLIPRILKEGFILPIKIFMANALIMGMLPIVKNYGYLKINKTK